MIMEKKLTTKQLILQAFDKSESKAVRAVCRTANVSPSAFYFHYYKDPEFRRQFLEKQRDQLNEQIEAIKT